MAIDEMFIVEHIRYSKGGNDEEESFCRTLAEAKELGLSMLQRFGGRMWINNQEYTRKDLEL